MLRKSVFIICCLCSAPCFAWEAYEFDVTYVNVVGGSGSYCEVGMTNLGAKQSSDANICDDPVEIRILNCDGAIGQSMLSIAISGKVSDKRLYHQAIAEVKNTPCIVEAYNIGLAP